MYNGVASLTHYKPGLASHCTMYGSQCQLITKNTVHRIENESSSPLHIIEVQFGDILDEEDIIRLEDDYGRIGN